MASIDMDVLPRSARDTRGPIAGYMSTAASKAAPDAMANPISVVRLSIGASLKTRCLDALVADVRWHCGGVPPVSDFVTEGPTIRDSETASPDLSGRRIDHHYYWRLVFDITARR
jgi:hypothetical protein